MFWILILILGLGGIPLLFNLLGILIRGGCLLVLIILGLIIILGIFAAIGNIH